MNKEDPPAGTIAMCEEYESLSRPLHGREDSDTIRLAALMASGIVHDFGNLMQVVSSAIRLIEQKLDRATLAKVGPVIEGASQSVERAILLSRQILGISRPDHAFEAAVCIKSALASIEHPICWMMGPSVRVELTIERDLPAVFCNIREFERAVLNLVINAKDAMPNGGDLRISACRDSLSDRVVVVICVNDTGCGMSPETARRAAQPLFTTKSTGSGLGLAMVSEFARRAGGSIQIESIVDRGTWITLRLPTCRR
jgi:signal transduction histidine kinase